MAFRFRENGTHAWQTDRQMANGKWLPIL